MFVLEEVTAWAVNLFMAMAFRHIKVEQKKTEGLIPLSVLLPYIFL